MFLPCEEVKYKIDMAAVFRFPAEGGIKGKSL